MVDEFEAMLFGDLVLKPFNGFVVEFDDLAAFQADHVVVMFLLGNLEQGMTTIEVMANDQASGFELSQYAVHGGQADIFTSIQQRLVDVLGAEMSLHVPGLLENLQDLDAGKRDFKPCPAQFMVLVGHGYSSQYRGGSVMIDQSNDSEEWGQMQNLIKTVIFSFVLVLVSGCSYFGVYKRDLAQGNLITEDMLAQLEPGMSREQVQYVMGSPLLEAPFDEDQWDYVFLLDEAYGGVIYKRLTLTFDDNRLVDMQTFGDIEADVDLEPESGLGPSMQDDALPGNVLDTTPGRSTMGGSAE